MMKITEYILEEKEMDAIIALIALTSENTRKDIGLSDENNDTCLKVYREVVKQ